MQCVVQLLEEPVISWNHRWYHSLTGVSPVISQVYHRWYHRCITGVIRPEVFLYPHMKWMPQNFLALEVLGSSTNLYSRCNALATWKETKYQNAVQNKYLGINGKKDILKTIQHQYVMVTKDHIYVSKL